MIARRSKAPERYSAYDCVDSVARLDDIGRRRVDIVPVLKSPVDISYSSHDLIVRYPVTVGLAAEESAHMYDLITRRASRLRLARIGPGEGPPSPS